MFNLLYKSVKYCVDNYIKLNVCHLDWFRRTQVETIILFSVFGYMSFPKLHFSVKLFLKDVLLILKFVTVIHWFDRLTEINYWNQINNNFILLLNLNM